MVKEKTYSIQVVKIEFEPHVSFIDALREAIVLAIKENRNVEFNMNEDIITIIPPEITLGNYRLNKSYEIQILRKTK